MVVNWENMMLLVEEFLDRRECSLYTSISILVDEVQFSILILLMIDDFLTSCSSCSISGCSRSMLRGMWHCGQSGWALVSSADLRKLFAQPRQKSWRHEDRMASSAGSSQMQHTEIFWPPSPCFFKIKSGWSATWRICMIKPKTLA